MTECSLRVWMMRLAPALAVGVAACEPIVVPFETVYYPADEAVVGPVQIVAETYGHASARVMATLPDGEIFRGPIVTERTEIEPAYITVYEGWHGGFPHWDTEIIRRWVYSGRAEGLLIGDRGRTMRCFLTLSYPTSGIPAGGFGDCEVSDGGTIEVIF